MNHADEPDSISSPDSDSSEDLACPLAFLLSLSFALNVDSPGCFPRERDTACVSGPAVLEFSILVMDNEAVEKNWNDGKPTAGGREVLVGLYCCLYRGPSVAAYLHL